MPDRIDTQRGGTGGWLGNQLKYRNMSAASPRSSFFHIYFICNEKLEVLGDSPPCLNKTVGLGLKDHHYSEEIQQVGNLALSEERCDGVMHGQDKYITLRGK